MNKITSQEALMSAFNAAKGKVALRSSDVHDINSVKKDILCCGGTGCHASNAQELMDNLNKYIKENGLENDVRVIQTGCFGFCAQGPIVRSEGECKKAYLNGRRIKGSTISHKDIIEGGVLEFK